MRSTRRGGDDTVDGGWVRVLGSGWVRVLGGRQSRVKMMNNRFLSCGRDGTRVLGLVF